MSGPEDVAPEVIGHYDRSDEVTRLDSGVGLVERDRTRRISERFLPPPPAVVVDVGGGAGVHALWLARAGYEVHLSDPVPKHIEQARFAAEDAGVALGSVTVGHAGDLAHGDGSADAVLALGPLYHLVDPDARAAALGEAFRVLRPGGRLFAAAINKYTSMINAFREQLLTDAEFITIVDGDLASGRHVNATGRADYFTTAFVHHPDELESELSTAGFVDVEILAVEGVAWTIGDIDRVWADDRARRELLRLLERTESEPALLGASPHLLGVGRRPDNS